MAGSHTGWKSSWTADCYFFTKKLGHFKKSLYLCRQIVINECEYKMDTMIKNNDIAYRHDTKSNNYLHELREKLPQKLNKLGEWFFSSDSDYQLQINDMKAVLK